MKKVLSFLLAAAGLSVGAGAAVPTEAVPFTGADGFPEIATIQAGGPAEAVSRAEGEYTIQFSGNIYSWSRINTVTSRSTVACIYITPELATRLAGNTLKTISFTAAYKGNTGVEYPGTIFVSEDMMAAPVSSTDITVVTVNTSSPTPQTETLDEPYLIKAGQGFYFGYTVKGGNANLYPIGYDSGPANDFAGYVGVLDMDGNLVTWASAAETFEANLYIMGGTEGPVSTLENFGYVASLSYPTFTLPVYWTDGTVSKPTFQIKNLGDNRLSSMEYAISVNGGEAEHQTATISIAKNGTLKRTIDSPALTEGFNTVTFHLYKLNDVECLSQASTYSVYMNKQDAVERKFVVEKATGTWCQYCPIGIVGFEEMQKLHPEEFVGMDLHTGDSFDIPDAQVSAFISAFSGGYVPMCIVNRDPLFVNSPSTSQLKTYYNRWNSDKTAIASITLEATNPADSKNINVKATPTFAINDANADYALAFVLLEDGLKGKQTNGYSGSTGAPGDWGSYPTYVDWIYTHTARSYTDVYGLDGSVPASVQKGTPYPYETTLDGSVLQDMEMSYVVALLLDRRTGVVLNAARANITKGAGLDNVISGASDSPAEYFNLQGIRVDNPQAGQLLIRRQGNTTSKVYIR